MSELQTVFVPMSLGVDESSRPEHTEGALEILNATQAQRGGLTKTVGYELLSTDRTAGSARSVGYRQFLHGTTPGTVDGTVVDLWNEVDTKSVPAGVDPSLGEDALSRVPPFRMTSDAVFGADGAEPKIVTTSSSAIQASWWDWCVCGDIGVAVYSYLSSAGVRSLGAVAWCVSTNQVFWSSTPISTGSVYATTRGIAAKLAVCGSTVLLAYEDGTATTISMKKMDCTSVTTASLGFTGGLAIADWNQTDFDLVGVSSSYAFLAYDVTGSGNLKLARIDVSGLTVAQSSTAATTTGTISGVAVAANGNTCWAVWGKNAAAQTWVCTVDISDVATATGTATSVMTHTNNTSHLGVVADSGTTAWVVGCDGQGSATDSMFSAPVSVVAGTPGLRTAKSTFKVLAPVSAPFVSEGRAYVWVFVNTRQTTTGGNPFNGQRTVFLIDITDDQWLLSEDLSAEGPTVHALPWPRVSMYGGAYLGSVTAIPIHSGPKSYSLTTGEIAMILPRLVSAVNIAFDIVRLDGADRYRWPTAHMNGTTHMAAPIACEFDGRRFHESNFVHRPVVSMSSSGVGTFTGNWGCTAIYEHVDSAGNIHWSAPADIVQVNVTNKVQLDWTVFRAQTRRGRQADQLRIVLYRTATNGSTYYRLATLNNPTVSAGLATYTDSVADATISVEQTLYGTTALPGSLGAPQPHASPAGLVTVWRHGNRMVGIGHDERTVWYSAELVDGEGAWWSDAFRIAVGSARKLVGGASQDGTLILFTDREVFAVTGDGPPENGGNGSEFSIPRSLSTDAGCINPLSIVTFGDGTMFQSHRGIELLTRSLSVNFVGEAVAQTLAAYPYISSAVFDQKASVVLFHCTTQTGSVVAGNGVTLVYDTLLKQWQKERYLESSNAGIPVQDALVSDVDGDPRRYIMRPSGAVYRQKSTANVSAYLDATNTWRTMRVGSPWFAVAGKSGEGWIRRLELMFERHTNHDLAISFYYDDSTSAEETITRTAQQIVDAGGRLDILPTRQRCRTFRVQVEDATPTSLSVGSGKGSTIYGLALAYEPMSGQERRPSTSR